MNHFISKGCVLFIFLFFSKYADAAYSWTRKADFGGGNREQSIGFSIGNYGYAGTGKDSVGKNDFWRYDPQSDAWTQVADYAGQGRYGMVGFSIATYGYAGTGWSGPTGGTTQYNDFWQYDPSINTWTQKTNFGGSARYSAIGFTIGNKGYVGLGFSPLKKDFWEYDPATDTWTQKMDFPNIRQAAVGFSIGTKGYVGTGLNQSTKYNDFYEYDPLNDQWTQKSNVPGLARFAATGFSVGGYGFIGMGASDTTYMTDFYRYDPANDLWTTTANIGGQPRYACFSFTIGNYAFAGTGSFGGIVTPTPTNTFWRFEDCNNSTAWIQQMDFGGGNREQSIGFSIGNYGYAGTGKDSLGKNDFWRYDPGTDSWTQVADYTGQGRYGMVSFAIGNSGYAGTGWSGTGSGIVQHNDFWQYDPSSNAWIQKANFGGSARYSAVGFSIGNKGYIGLGFSPLKKDFWEYDPVTDTWAQKMDFPFLRQAATGFSIGNKGYVGTGLNQSTKFNDFFEYDPSTDTWTQKSNVPGLARLAATGFAIGGYGYIGMGASDTTYMTDFYIYDPSIDRWSAIASIGGQPRYASFTFTIANYGYVGTGSFGGMVTPIPTNTFWRLANCDGSPLGIEEHVQESKNIFISVTPDNDGLKLNYHLTGEKSAIFNLYDCLGRTIASVKLNTESNAKQIPLSLNPQIYFYSVTNESGVLKSGKVMMN